MLYQVMIISTLLSISIVWLWVFGFMCKALIGDCLGLVRRKVFEIVRCCCFLHNWLALRDVVVWILIKLLWVCAFFCALRWFGVRHMCFIPNYWFLINFILTSQVKIKNQDSVTEIRIENKKGWVTDMNCRTPHPIAYVETIICIFCCANLI